MLAFRILFEDDFVVAVDKPAGFHSHPPEDKSLPCPYRWNALAILQNQLNQALYPAHRLDRSTSGVLLFSKKREWNSRLQQQFQNNAVKKSYLALARGEIFCELEIESPLKNEKGEQQPSSTKINPLYRVMLAHQGSKRPFTLVWAEPKTGRFHQIRRHLAHISHPILGDNAHGDKKLNREIFVTLPRKQLFLRAIRLELLHPESQKPLKIEARWGKNWHTLFDLAGFCPIL